MSQTACASRPQSRALGAMQIVEDLHIKRAAARPVSVHDRHNVSTVVDPARAGGGARVVGDPKISVTRAGRLCETQ